VNFVDPRIDVYAAGERSRASRRRVPVALASLFVGKITYQRSGAKRLDSSRQASSLSGHDCELHPTFRPGLPQAFNRIRPPGQSSLGLARANVAVSRYCLSNKITLLTLSPLAFLPVCVAVIVLPSAETATLVVTVGLPSILPMTSNVRSSIRLRAFVVFGA
jgi:hypothetical protein